MRRTKRAPQIRIFVSNRETTIFDFKLSIHKSKEHVMATDFVGADAANPSNPTAAKCPFTGATGPRKHTVAGGPTNAAWWPDQLNLKILHQNSVLSNPMDEKFDYAKE